MSVLASKRTIAKTEYAHNFLLLYEFTLSKIKKLAKRRYKWLGEPIVNIITVLYEKIVSLCAVNKNNPIPSEDYEKVESIIKDIYSLQKPLLALWNSERYETKQMINWAELLNKELKLLFNLIGGELEEKNEMFILDFNYVNSVQFLSTMSELHNFIYTKTISLPTDYRHTSGNLLMNLADDALYCLAQANRFTPKTKEMYDRRTEWINRAIDDIRSMEYPVASLFITQKYSNSTMIKWASTIDKELRLLYGLKKSDKKRFNDLT